ncbi:hypothetical protein ACHAXR_011660 [Thalassiosira sp. AJA248-18]
MSTVTYITSSSSSSSQESSLSQSNANNKFHNLSLDLASIDNSDSSEDGMLLPGHSRESSYSDISSDGGGGYYDRFARHRQRSVDAWYLIENYLLTRHNFKVVISFLFWFISYMIMGVFGGSVAFLHFERRDKDVPDPLPDFGYDIIPYYCPTIQHVPHSNVQSVVLFILYALILSGVALRWKPRYHPKTGTVIWGGDGRLILQHMFHLNCLVFLSRTTTVGLTGLPQPNPKCVEQQHFPVTFGNALMFVMGRGFPPHACGDLVYSGHVGCTLICMAVLHRHGFLKNKLAAILVWLVAVIGIYFTISCRSHYSVDVVLAFYFGYFLPEWYFNRSDGRVRGRMSRWIKRLEVRPSDLRRLDYDADNEGGERGGGTDAPQYPSTISV